MTTSGSTDFSTTTANIITDALLLINAIDPAEPVPAHEFSIGQRYLQMLSKYLMTKVQLWPTKDISHTLTPGTKSYSVGIGQDIDTSRPLRLMSARRIGSDGHQIDIETVSRQEYKRLPDKNVQAPPNEVYYDPQLNPAYIYVWPTGNANNKDVEFTFLRPLEDFDSASNTPDYPQEWYLCLVYQLASRIAPIYKGGIPQDIKAEADALLVQLMRWDTEYQSFKIIPTSSRRGRR